MARTFLNLDGWMDGRMDEWMDECMNVARPTRRRNPVTRSSPDLVQFSQARRPCARRNRLKKRSFRRFWPSCSCSCSRSRRGTVRAPATVSAPSHRLRPRRRPEEGLRGLPEAGATTPAGSAAQPCSRTRSLRTSTRVWLFGEREGSGPGPFVQRIHSRRHSRLRGRPFRRRRHRDVPCRQ